MIDTGLAYTFINFLVLDSLENNELSILHHLPTALLVEGQLVGNCPCFNNSFIILQ